MTVSTLLLSALSILFGPVAGVGAGPAGEQVVHWRDREYEVNKLPARIPAAAREAVAAWRRWAGEAEYGLHLTHDGTVLVVGPVDPDDVKDQLELVERVRKKVDEEVPAPDRSAAPPATAGLGGEAGDALPEDPGGPLPEDPGGPLPEDPGVDLGTTTVAAPGPSVYGAEALEPDTATAVLFIVRNESQYGDLVDALVERHAYLDEWAADTRENPGFVLGYPLTAAYVVQAAGQEEFDPKNELVNRTARLLLLRRFGELPNWVVHGWAWHVEIALRKSVYVFPYRNEFVFVTEHTDWDKDLRNRFRERDRPLRMDEFASWRRGAYSDSHARVAWGVIEFLARHHQDALSPFLERLRVVRDRESRIDKGDGTWVRDRDYEVPMATQESLLKELVGPDVLERLVEFFIEGDDYRPPKAKRR